jgi:hypothetical protein
MWKRRAYAERNKEQCVWGVRCNTARSVNRCCIPWPLLTGYRPGALSTNRHTISEHRKQVCPCKICGNNDNKSKLTNYVEQEPEGSSPHLQHPATGPYPEPVESNPHTPDNLPTIHSDPILPSKHWSSEWSLSFRLSHQILVQFYILSHACHMPCPSHCLDLICLMISGDEFLTVQLPPFSRHLIPLRSVLLESNQNNVLEKKKKYF